MYTMKESNPLICPLLLQLVIDHLVFIQGERFGGALDGSSSFLKPTTPNTATIMRK